MLPIGCAENSEKLYLHRGFELSIICLIADDDDDVDGDDDFGGLRMGLEGVFLITK